MKSRPLTWLLAVATLAVWSVIGWKLFSVPRQTESSPVDKLPSVVPVLAVDTLRLDFRDPFSPVREPSSGNAGVAASVPHPRPDRLSKSGRKPSAVISCLGRIRKGGVDYFLLFSGGETSLLKVGETAGGITLRNAWPDSLRIVRDDDELTVKCP